jgi:hypothetical protein
MLQEQPSRTIAPEVYGWLGLLLGLGALPFGLLWGVLTFHNTMTLTLGLAFGGVISSAYSLLRAERSTAPVACYVIGWTTLVICALVALASYSFWSWTRYM